MSGHAGAHSRDVRTVSTAQRLATSQLFVNASRKGWNV